MKLQETTDGGFFITVPKQLADAKGFEKGQELEWQVNEEGQLVLREK
ncbi:MAG: AbrB/MazE/SpoVT family DNA-binding domain-containing protein [Candidatus Nanosalina sp.]